MNDQDRWNRLFEKGQDCPSVEELGNFLTNSRTQGEESHLATHVRDCTRCSTEITLLRQFDEAEAKPAEKNDVAIMVNSLEENVPNAWRSSRTRSEIRPRSSFWRNLFADVLAFKPMPLLATAMAGVLVVMVASLLLRTAPEIAPILNSGPAFLRSETIRISSPKGDVEQVPRELSWIGLIDADGYEVRISEVDRTEVLVLTTQTDSVKLSPEIRGDIAAGKPLFWQVTAFDASGRRIGQSELTRFAVPKTN